MIDEECDMGFSFISEMKIAKCDNGYVISESDFNRFVSNNCLTEEEALDVISFNYDIDTDDINILTSEGMIINKTQGNKSALEKERLRGKLARIQQKITATPKASKQYLNLKKEAERVKLAISRVK